MKGDFSRSTFDPNKHYISVRMQQGRVQLDADWNEQADIMLHLIATQLKDLLGSGATAVTDPPGFAITFAEPQEEPVDQDQMGQSEEHPALPDFRIGAGRYYVDGILCENQTPVLFSEQPDYPAAASLVQAYVDCDHFLVYLDVWSRHITAIEDPAICEIALGGADTTTRVKTVWQVKLLPLSCDPTDDSGWRERGGFRFLADGERFMIQATDSGQLRAKWQKDKGAFLENHLYRVEIHTVTGDQVTFKWSRDNGSVVFPVVDLPLVQKNGEDSLLVTVEHLERDPHQLKKDSLVELVDDVTVLNGSPLPLCKVKEMDRSNALLTLCAEKGKMERIFAEIGTRELRNPLLRHWEAETKSVARPENIASDQDDGWSDLENGIQVAFSDTGTYQVGDYWLIPARTRSKDGIEWPQSGGQPLAQAPHGIAHHYAPLAQLQFEEGEWRVISDKVDKFNTLPQVDARLARAEVNLREHVEDLERLGKRVTVLEERQADIQAHLVQDFQMGEDIEMGHVVSVVPQDPSDEPDSELRVRRTSAENKRDRHLVVGVATDIFEDRKSCRVVLYGRARCKAVGEIEPGDVLVPSVKLGYAQKAGRSPRLGTIIGKALSSNMFDIDEDDQLGQVNVIKRTGTVDMLVMLR